MHLGFRRTLSDRSCWIRLSSPPLLPSKSGQISEADRRRIVELAEDLPRLWRARTTTDRDRKMLLRLLVQDIAVSRTDVPRSAFRLRILWHTQAITEIEVDYLGPGHPSRKLTWRVIGVTPHRPPKRAC